MIKLTKNQRGDTIVEVLIALAVVGTMLTGAYASARRSMFAVVASQERLEALKLAEGQLEMIKYNISASPSPDSISIMSPSFCMNSSASAVGMGPYCHKGTDSRYSMEVSRTSSIIAGPPPPVTEYTFTVVASWDRIGGGGNDSLSLSYKVRR